MKGHPAEVRADDPSRLELWALGTVAAACLVISVTFKLNDPDFWQHLLVGKAIWQLHTIPRIHQWSWPTFGTPEVLPSWGFRALIWPFWSIGQVLGLFAWRWLTTVGTFAIAWLTARRLGARGLLPLVVIVVCGLIYRYRSQVRPETLAHLLLVLELLVLEIRRQGGRDHTRWIVPIAIVWANIHISYYLSLLLPVFYLTPWATPPPKRSQRSLALTSAAAALGCLLNPFGWKALVQPIQYFFTWRHEPIYQSIAELHGIDWQFHARDGLIPLMVLWPLLQLWRTWNKRPDWVEATLWAFFTWLAVFNQRFLGTWAILASVFVSRDLSVGVPWAIPRPLRRAFAPLAALVCVLLCLPEWSRRDIQPGIGIDPLSSPVAACDFIEREDIRGRFFNHFELGGYLAWRFWPDRSRLPFMDIHQSGTRMDRLLYEASMSNRATWHAAAERYRFDVAVLRRLHARGDDMLNFLDADSSWALVFVDDVAAIYIRRPLAVPESLIYQVVPGGMEHLARLGETIDRVPGLRSRFRDELERVTRESQASSSALSLLATLDIQEQRWGGARLHLAEAHRIDPLLPMYYTRLAQIDEAERRWSDRLRDLREAKRHGELPTGRRP